MPDITISDVFTQLGDLIIGKVSQPLRPSMKFRLIHFNGLGKADVANSLGGGLNDDKCSI
jgi:hypothetical protein